MTKQLKTQGSRKPRGNGVDSHVGKRISERRAMLGIKQPQLAQAIGVSYQQIHKYEIGINRVAAGRLYHLSRALGTDVGYFFEGMPEHERLKVKMWGKP